jgi:hypothetical protein
MNRETFERLMNELDGNSLETLLKKNAKYAPGDDALHNFNAGADIMGGTAAQACWGYLTKHLVALRDKVMRDDFHDRADLLEKCQDSINYIRFLWCIANAELDKYAPKVNNESAGVAEEKHTAAYLREKAKYEKHLAETKVPPFPIGAPWDSLAR